MGNPSPSQRQAQRLNELHDAEESGSLLANGQNNGASHHSQLSSPPLSRFHVSF